ncbi:T9SS type A sorting domain-containing protein [Croceimicrobium sp.]|uniref:T9SS type A sorting domain-containing protein n=1 Tax=Croceimicrobium sp. TaxID=2828340 RepID=UPI003BA9B7C0
MRKYLITSTLLFAGLFSSYLLWFQNLDAQVDIHQEYANFLAQHPFNQDQGISLKDWEKLPKADRPDLAEQQNFIMTMDPALGYPTPERLLAAKSKLEQARLSFLQKTALDSSNLPDLLWEERGPYDVGGRTRALMYDPNDSSHKKVWAGAVSGGLWYTTDISDPTNPWVPVDDFWQSLGVSCMAYDPTNPQIFYVGTGEGLGELSSTRGQGVWKTSDGGQSWNQLSSSIDFDAVRDIAVRNENGNGVLYVGVRDASYNGFEPTAGNHEGLYRSIDGGQTFNQVMDTVPGTLYNYAVADIEIGPDNRIWIGTTNSISTNGSRGGGAILYSDDGLNFFRARNTNGNRVEVAVAPSNAAFIYALIENNGIIHQMLRSTDSGSSWQAMNRPDDDDPGIPSHDFTRGQAWYDLIAQVDPNDEATLLVGGINIFRSTDTGTSWTQLSQWYGGTAYPYLHADQHQIVFKPGSSDEALFGNDGGVARSTSLQSPNPAFSTQNAGYNVTQFYAGDLSPYAGSNQMIAGAQDNGTQRFSQSGFGTTNRATGGDGAYCFIDQISPNFWMSSYVYNNYYRSFNSGNSFGQSFINNGDGRFINPADYDPNLNILYACKNSYQFYRYSNVNSQVNEEVVRLTGLRDRISHIRVSPFIDDTTTIWVASGVGIIFRVDSADVDDHEIFTEITGSNFPAGYISCIEVGESEKELIATFSNYGIPSVFYTEDGGQNWMNKEGDLPDMPVRWCLINPRDKQNVILATELGIWETRNFLDSMPNWNPANNGLANVRVDMLKMRKSDYTIMATTHGRGVYTAQFKGGLSIAENALTNEEKGWSIYPNPSNNQFQIDFEAEGIWELELFNLQGQRILQDRWSEKNPDRIYNIAHLAKGEYILNLRKGAKRHQQKLIIL